MPWTCECSSDLVFASLAWPTLHNAWSSGLGISARIVEMGESPEMMTAFRRSMDIVEVGRCTGTESTERRTSRQSDSWPAGWKMRLGEIGHVLANRGARSSAQAPFQAQARLPELPHLRIHAITADIEALHGPRTCVTPYDCTLTFSGSYRSS